MVSFSIIDRRFLLNFLFFATIFYQLANGQSTANTDGSSGSSPGECSSCSDGSHLSLVVQNLQTLVQQQQVQLQGQASQLAEQRSQILQLKAANNNTGCQQSPGRILVQQHHGGTGFFNRNWAAFKAGFGSEDGDYWIGNDRLHNLTKDGHYKIRFDLVSRNNNQSYWAEYSTFVVGDEASKYLLHVTGYTGTARDSVTGSHSIDGTKFTTYDRDNDKFGHNCANYSGIRGGFWYNACAYVFINNVDSTIWGFAWHTLPDGGSGKKNLLSSRMTLIQRCCC